MADQGLPGRFWLDITNISPGSNAGVWAASLAAALRRHHVSFTLCQDESGLWAKDSAYLQTLTEDFKLPSLEKSRIGRQHHFANMLPDRARIAIGRFLQLQTLASRSWRSLGCAIVTHTSHHLRRRAPVRVVRPESGDVVVRIAENGIAVSRWPQRLATVIAPAPCLAPRELDFIAPRRPFVLAAGEIGVGGQTRHLLLAWRCLLDQLPPEQIPLLVLAGPIGALSRDVLTQLRHSHFLEDHVEVRAFASAAEISSLLTECHFCLAPAARQKCDRVVLDSQAAQAACLSATEFDFGNARLLADTVQRWMQAPPPPPPASARNWDDVVRELQQVIAR